MSERDECHNIAYAQRFNRKHFDDDTAFADWAQSRARFALDTPPAPPPAPEPLVVTLTAKDGSKVDVFGNAPPAPDDLVRLCTEYLSLGGLWNPESMDHNKVRDLILDCRAAIVALRERVQELERMEKYWPRFKPVMERAERAEADNAKLRRDAERYRWLRGADDQDFNSLLRDMGDSMDDAVDAAMAALEKPTA